MVWISEKPLKPTALLNRMKALGWTPVASDSAAMVISAASLGLSIRYCATIFSCAGNPS